ncbi:hypothetical protein OLX02_12825 [Novosphingobium sp. KCTC 2891]|uniref:hypothetical protein n=1 Tax=Novosphingobium sp. KCTC 2891 TaxID=2989730 RepID=UPI002223BAD0|nr:hypothetical protein [Novosphingobium sp. KCTC 2891]MCW1383706.1 hypothetical protein [Novosphingobium sp. KCTC 2891]
MLLIPVLLLLHGLIAVALLGAITHQAAAVLREGTARGTAHPRASFAGRYAAVASRGFANAVIALYVATLVLGGLVYPAYRLDVRPAFEEMELGWAVGLFELKEHWGGIGLALLPLYRACWRQEDGAADHAMHKGRTGVTLTLAFIVWFDFIAGHLLNNLRGL